MDSSTDKAVSCWQCSYVYIMQHYILPYEVVVIISFLAFLWWCLALIRTWLEGMWLGTKTLPLVMWLSRIEFWGRRKPQRETKPLLFDEPLPWMTLSGWWAKLYTEEGWMRHEKEAECYFTAGLLPDFLIGELIGERSLPWVLWIMGIQFTL